VVGVGVAAYGLTSYGFLVIAARALGPSRYASLSALWAIVYVLSPGFFLPVEQEINRIVVRPRAGTGRSGPLLRRAFIIAGFLATALSAVALASGPLAVDRVFDGDRLLLLSLVLALLAYATQHVVRGAVSGLRQYGRYAAMLSLEGVARMAACAAIAAAGVSAAGAYGLIVGLAPLVSTVPGWAAARHVGRSGPGIRWPQLMTAIGYLVVSAVFAQFLAMSGPVAVKLLAAPGHQAAAGRFLASLAIARIPIFLFQAVQPPLLSRLSRLAGRGLFSEFTAAVKRLMVAVGAMGGLAILAIWILGPWIVDTFFGRGFSLRRTDLVYLAGGTAGYLVAVGLAQALIALSLHSRVAVAWVAGSAGFIIRIALGSDLVTRVAQGFLLGSIIAALAMAIVLALGLRPSAPRPRVTVPGPVAQEP
jgi:O-antigen/teichoic acid export membrane protein